jgi:hypothetical protein
MESLLTLVALLTILSVASERQVEIVKGFVPFLNNKNEDADKERWRKVSLQLLGIGAGILTVLLTKSAIIGVVPELFPSTTNVWLPILALGLLASGGSGLWNALLTYFLQAKDLKKLSVAELQTKITAQKESKEEGEESAESQVVERVDLAPRPVAHLGS